MTRDNKGKNKKEQPRVDAKRTKGQRPPQSKAQAAAPSRQAKSPARPQGSRSNPARNKARVNKPSLVNPPRQNRAGQEKNLQPEALHNQKRTNAKVLKKSETAAKKKNFFSRKKKLHPDVKTSSSKRLRKEAKLAKAKDKAEQKAEVDLLIGDTRVLRASPLRTVREVREASYGFSLKSIFFSVAVVLLVSVLIIVALYRLQIKDHEEIRAEAAKQYYARSLELPTRGDIYDRNGFKLASTTYLYRVGITPKHLYSRSKSVEADEIYSKLAELLNLSFDEVKAAAQDEDAAYIQLTKDLTYEKGQELEEFLAEHQIGGVKMDAEPHRVYFNDDLASQVIGFTSTEGQILKGRLGVELSYDDILSGQRGYTYGARMNYGDYGAMPFTQSSSLAKRDGSHLYLTIDRTIQKILQDHLEEACIKYAATEDGMAVAMDPYTGEIYGMASYPYFRSSDPTGPPSKFDERTWEEFKFDNLKNFSAEPYPKRDGQEPSQAELAQWELSQRKITYLSSSVWRNKVISDVYEAGSTFKAITAAIGFEENVTNEQVSYNDAKIQVLDYWISCYSGDQGHGYVTMEDGFALSCNPVFVQISLQTGIDKFYEYVEAFGFREPTGINLPGEANCIFHDNPTLIDLATLSFGEQSSVTPLHMMRAYAALVNGGKLITPTIVKEVRAQDGELLMEAPVEVARQVVSESTSARIRELMKKMVDISVNYTNAGGYNVGGKTSTSVDEATGYTTVSFMEAAPIEHPRLLVMFIVQKPENPAVGGVEAQVLTMDATSEILEYLNIDRDLNEGAGSQAVVPTMMPGIIGMTYEQAADFLKWRRIPLRMGSKEMSKDDIISAQSPAEGSTIFPGNAAYVYTEAFPKVEMVKMPDFSGKNAFECITEANRSGLIVNFEGDMKGTCFAQRASYILPDDPTATENIVEEPGYELPKGSIVRLALSLEGGLNE
ncbi:MAG: penicillin-binding transpeptidase domain-containing protein [Eubacteriales bacterium]|nr:penicillin-binding transpeptidase domain-containing protein [Eubacteriales bacterium]